MFPVNSSVSIRSILNGATSNIIGIYGRSSVQLLAGRMPDESTETYTVVSYVFRLNRINNFSYTHYTYKFTIRVIQKPVNKYNTFDDFILYVIFKSISSLQKYF